MDVSRSQGRIISILNDNDCPSFAVRRPQSPPAKELPLPLRHLPERPQLPRYRGYAKQQSPPSEPSTPPLLRHDSSASSTSSRMDNSPSPITPEYPYLDAHSNVITPYDAILQQHVNGYLPSPTGITPLMETSMLLGPAAHEAALHYAPKVSAFPTMPSPAPTSNNSAHSAVAAVQVPQVAPQQQPQQPPIKKNKYPCPYANSHGCVATFTTSGHAARHGKKHTGEKGVHCPTCGKAFTRKDNMKQHERTHKNSASSSATNSSTDSRKSKAAVTKAAVAERSHKRAMSEAKSTASGRKDSVHSPLTEVTSVDIVTPSLMASSSNEEVLYMDSVQDPMPPTPQQHEAMLSVYPPLDEATLGQINQRPMPSFPRTFSDLDTLAMAAGAYDPYHSAQ